MISLPHRRMCRAAAVLGGTVLLSGCGASGSGARKVANSADLAQPVPFSAASSIAAPKHANVVRAGEALAAAEYALYQEMSPVQGSLLDAYLHRLAGASANTQRYVQNIAAHGSCTTVGTAVTAASAGVTKQLDAAVGRFDGQVSTIKAHLAKVATDRAAVAKATAALKAALVDDPGAWQVPGVDTSGTTLESTGEWQITEADAIATSQNKAASYSAIRDQTFTRALGVRRSCLSAASRERVRAVRHRTIHTPSTATRSAPHHTTVTEPTPGSGKTSIPAETATTPTPTPTLTGTTTPTPTPTGTTTPTPTPTGTTTPTPTETTTTPPATTSSSPATPPASTAVSTLESTSASTSPSTGP